MPLISMKLQNSLLIGEKLKKLENLHATFLLLLTNENLDDYVHHMKNRKVKELDLKGNILKMRLMKQGIEGICNMREIDKKINTQIKVISDDMDMKKRVFMKNVNSKNIIKFYHNLILTFWNNISTVDEKHFLMSYLELEKRLRSVIKVFQDFESTTKAEKKLKYFALLFQLLTDSSLNWYATSPLLKIDPNQIIILTKSTIHSMPLDNGHEELFTCSINAHPIGKPTELLKSQEDQSKFSEPNKNKSILTFIDDLFPECSDLSQKNPNSEESVDEKDQKENTSERKITPAKPLEPKPPKTKKDLPTLFKRIYGESDNECGLSSSDEEGSPTCMAPIASLPVS